MKSSKDFVTETFNEDKVLSGYRYTIDLDKPYVASEHENMNMSRVEYIKTICSLASTVNKKNRKSHPDTDNEFQVFVGGVYDEWEKRGFDPGLIPFRFNPKQSVIKLCRAYEDFATTHTGTQSNKGKWHDKVGSVTVELGNGFGGGAGGYKFEDDVCGAIKKWICNYFETTPDMEKEYDVKVCAAVRLLSSDKAEYNGEPVTQVILSIISKATGRSNLTLQDLKEMNADELIKVVDSIVNKGNESFVTTGKNKTNRPFDTLVPVDDKNIEDGVDENDTLALSGGIISDVTIGTKNTQRMYISVKAGKAQLTGSTVSPSSDGRRWMSDVLGDENIDPKEAEISSAKFNDFFSMLGLDPNEVRVKFTKAKKSNRREDFENINNDSKNSKKLARVIQNLIGGDYLYLTPDKCCYVPVRVNNNLRYNTQSAYIRGGGKGIMVFGDIRGLEINLELRTDGHGEYPARLFPIIGDLEDFIDMLSE